MNGPLRKSMAYAFLSQKPQISTSFFLCYVCQILPIWSFKIYYFWYGSSRFFYVLVVIFSPLFVLFRWTLHISRLEEPYWYTNYNFAEILRQLNLRGNLDSVILLFSWKIRFYEVWCWNRSYLKNMKNSHSMAKMNFRNIP